VDHETESTDTQIIEVEGANQPSGKPMPLKVFLMLLRRRQQYIDAGLIPDVPLPPHVYPPDYPHDTPPDTSEGSSKS
jgi:hypothetical protein